MGVLLLLSGIWYPPEFPKLPQGYSEWKEFTNVSCPLDPFFRDNGFNGADVEKDSSLIPYYMPSNKTYGYKNEETGVVKHYSSTSDNIWVDVPNDYILVYWFPHIASDTLVPRPLYNYGGYISYDTSGFQKITVNGNEAYRIRGKWWVYACDGADHESGSFTNYIISTNKLDFRITCLSTTYIYYTEGETVGPDHYPDRIAELERAVEETFRPK